MSTAEFYEGSDLEALADLPHYYAWIADLLAPSGSVLEVGAGTGNFTAAYRERATDLTLVEPSQHAATLAERFAGDPGVSVHRGTLQDVLAGQPAWKASYDCVVMVNVLEHVRDDVDLLRACASTLRRGGRLLIAVPALQWLYGTLDQLVDHQRRYTRTSLRRAATEAGFEVCRLHYMDGLGVLPWFVAGRVLRQQRFNSRAAGLYDRACVPLLRRAEAVVRPRVGKNLVLVARR